MRKSILLVLTFLVSSQQLLRAQVPMEFNYQAVARDNKGIPLADKDINVRFSIRSDNAIGTIEYQEIRKLRTNMFGMFSVSIGSGNAFYSSGSLMDVKWGKGKRFLGVEIDFETTGNYIDMGATQMVSVPYALFASRSLDTIRAGQGINLKNGILDFGYTKNDTASSFKESRYLFLNDNDLRLKDGNAELIFSREGLTIQQDSGIIQNDNMNSGGVFLRVNPIFPREDATPFLFSRMATQQHNGAASPNEVVMWGHNLSPGGNTYIKGLPAIGYSLESNYKPDPNDRIVESHEYYVNPKGKQIRLKSYTIKTDVDDVDYYQTISRLYLKNPLSNEEYFHVNTSDDNMTQTLALGNLKILQSREEKDGNSMSQTQILGGNKFSELFLNTGWKNIYLPGLLFQENTLLRLMGNLIPENDNQYNLGHFSNRFSCISSINFKGQKAILRSNWSSTENITPTSTLDIEGMSGFDQLRLRKSYTPSGSNDPNGNTGDISWDEDFIYIKTAKGWKRTSLTDF